MPGFNDKESLITFFETLLKNLKTNLDESAFDVNLNIVPIDSNNLQVIMEAFKRCQRVADKLVTVPK